MDSLQPATQSVAPAHKPAYKRLTQEQLLAMLELRKLGKTQTQIAETLGCDQASVCRALAQFTDTTEHATAFLRGMSLRMAKNIVSNGLARDHIAALKGINVLNEDTQKGGVTVIVGGRASVQVNVGAPFAPQASPVSADIHSLSADTGSDNS